MCHNDTGYTKMSSTDVTKNENDNMAESKGMDGLSEKSRINVKGSDSKGMDGLSEESSINVKGSDGKGMDGLSEESSVNVKGSDAKGMDGLSEESSINVKGSDAKGMDGLSEESSVNVKESDGKGMDVLPRDSGVNASEGVTSGHIFKYKKCLCSVFPVRYIVIGLACVGMIIVNAMRTNIGFTAITILDEQSHLKVGTAIAVASLPNVLWDTVMIGFLHSIFYIGYLVTHIPGGYLATKLPCYRLYGASILLSSALNLLLPTAISDVSYTFTCIVRFLQGLSEGLLYPACYGILRHWSTPQERGRTGSTVLTGAYFGAVLGFPVAGIITHFIGWQYIFYLNGGVGIVWVLVWLCFASEKPSHHALISDEELAHLQKSQGDGVLNYEGEYVPWRQIIKSPPVIVLCICHFARNWVFVLMLTNEPFYLSIFGFSIAENGLYSSIPHMAKVLCAVLSGFIADWLLVRKLLNTTNVRKLLTGVAFGIQTCGFYLLTFMGEQISVIIVLSIAVGAGGFAVSGWQINHYDLSTRHASFLVGLSSTVGNIASVAAPLIAGHLTQNEDTQGWRDVFYFTTGIVALAFIFFVTFGSGEQQEWACPPEHINLIQKADPLARKMYTSHTIQSKSQENILSLSGDNPSVTKPYRAYSLQLIDGSDPMLLDKLPDQDGKDIKSGEIAGSEKLQDQDGTDTKSRDSDLSKDEMVNDDVSSGSVSTDKKCQ